MGGRYAVRTVVLESGERLPFLLNCDTGGPLFDPTVYALTELRARGRATATIDQALRAVMVLYTFLDSLGLDLDERLAEGRLLQLGEIDELARECRLPLEVIGQGAPPSSASLPRRLRPSSLEKVRSRSVPAQTELDPSSAALRLRYIRDYLRWVATDRLLKLTPGHPRHSALVRESEIVARVLSERVPSTAVKDFEEQRQGLAPECMIRLHEVIDRASPANPWRGAHARERNALLVNWLTQLGVRRGELLGVRIGNINFQTNEVRITRQADDPTDPRLHQPNTKTRGRLLPMDEDLVQLTHDYILNTRRKFEGARKHDFLFVANGTGAPLSLAAVDKIFAALRSKCPALPPDLSPHVLRHTWNDRFSEVMDKNRVSEDTERKIRARLMGWSETSKTAAIYTRRHTHKRAREASLELQSALSRAKPK